MTIYIDKYHQQNAMQTAPKATNKTQKNAKAWGNKRYRAGKRRKPQRKMKLP